MKPRRVLVTGAGGFVGNALALGFARLDWEVIGLVRSTRHGRTMVSVRLPLNSPMGCRRIYQE